MIPAACVTCPAFGGVGGREIFITTARTDLTVVLDGDDGDETKGEEGAVYRLHVDVRGLKKNKFILSRK
jgi:sugar lactone lactonase YvrE